MISEIQAFISERPWLPLLSSLLVVTFTLLNYYREAFFGIVEPLAHHFAERFLKTGKRRKVRVATRIRWMTIKRYWRENLSFRSLWILVRRPTVLIIFGLGLPVVLWYSLGVDYLLNRRQLVLSQQVEWRAIAQPLLILIGLPAAFILWAFRDYNAQANLENQRKDINLKEFQEIQLRAAGAMDEKLPAKARETLQVAAIHQLRPYLRGEYGQSFRRPAWELLRARLETSAQETGSKAISDWTESGSPLGCEIQDKGCRGKSIASEIQKYSNYNKPSLVTITERTLISEESDRLLRKGLPLTSTRFGGSILNGALLSRLNFSGSFFVGAQLIKAHLENAILVRTHLEGADLRWAHLEGANLTEAHLEGANLRWAHLEDADLRFAHLEGAMLIGAFLNDTDLSRANLDGADLIGAHLERADLSGASLVGTELKNACLEGTFFDSSTQFKRNWDLLTSKEKDDIRRPFIARGMLHSDLKTRTRRRVL